MNEQTQVSIDVMNQAVAPIYHMMYLYAGFMLVAAFLLVLAQIFLRPIVSEILDMVFPTRRNGVLRRIGRMHR